MTEFVDFPSIGYLETTVPDDLYESLTRGINQNLEENNLLNYGITAGHIEETYGLDIGVAEWEKFEDWILDRCQEYVTKYNIFRFYKCLPPEPLPLQLHQLWFNYQKKGEYNPVHNHAGIFSFVIWVQIPYKLEDEFKHESVDRVSFKTNSLFSFHYTNHLGRTEDFLVGVDKNYEKKMILFPAEVAHQVYPFFTSDGIRISISGNVGLHKKEKFLWDRKTTVFEIK